ncbi:MAG: XdhC family protein [Candidatus Latescibacterota bacterium]
MKNIYIDLAAKLTNKETVAVATIVETKGSSPQVPGASALFSPSGLIAGTLGGGWLEAAAQTKVLAAIGAGRTCLSAFSLRSHIDAEEGAICGGDIQILIDARPAEHSGTFAALAHSLDQRESGVLLTLLTRAAGGDVTISRHWICGGTLSGEGTSPAEGILPAMDVPSGLAPYNNDITQAIAGGRTCLLNLQMDASMQDDRERLLFVEPIQPSPDLVIVGAGHIGRALTHLGSLLNFEVTVIDDRAEFANKAMLPDADHIIIDSAGRALAAWAKKAVSYFVIVTHGHQQDADALRQVITSGAAYIGMIGSTRKIALMRDKFIKQGWATAEQFDRVHAPIGIDIPCETVEEIAVSIAAELVAVRKR